LKGSEIVNKTVLCIDDAPDILLLYKRLLESHGYNVVLASNGREGLELMRCSSVDCVILDYQMPGMDGAEVVRSVSHDNTLPPVILVSGADPPRELREQVDAFIEKPTAIFELLERVEAVIG
jgi:two-component system, sensor histidine kinase and response regulator